MPTYGQASADLCLLPNPVLVIIWNYLDFRARYRLFRVSRSLAESTLDRLANALLDLPPLHLDLWRDVLRHTRIRASANASVNAAAPVVIDRVFRSCGHAVLSLTICPSPTAVPTVLDARCMQLIGQYCCNLERLVLRNATISDAALETAFLDRFVNLKSLTLDHPNLSSLMTSTALRTALQRMPQLRTFQLSGCVMPDVQLILEGLQSCHHLVELTIDQTCPATAMLDYARVAPGSLRCLSLRLAPECESWLPILMQHALQLEKLELRHWFGWSESSDVDENVVAHVFTTTAYRVRTLLLENPLTTPVTIAAVCQHMNTLESLSLLGRNQMTLIPNWISFRNLRILRNVSFEDFEFSNAAFEDLLKHCGANLESLRLAGCKLERSSILASVVSACPRLRSLDVTGLKLHDVQLLKRSDFLFIIARRMSEAMSGKNDEGSKLHETVEKRTIILDRLLAEPMLRKTERPFSIQFPSNSETAECIIEQSQKQNA